MGVRVMRCALVIVWGGMEGNAMEGKGKRWKEREEDGRAAEHLR